MLGLLMDDFHGRTGPEHDLSIQPPLFALIVPSGLWEGLEDIGREGLEEGVLNSHGEEGCFQCGSSKVTHAGASYSHTPYSESKPTPIALVPCRVNRTGIAPRFVL